MTISLPTLLRRSLVHRRARSLSALTALTVSAAVATALLTLYASLDQKLHHEFRSFGANIIVTWDLVNDPDRGLDLEHRLQRVTGHGARSAGFSYVVAQTDRGTPVVVVGIVFDSVRELDSWWQVAQWPTGHNDALLGDRAAQFVSNEKQVTLSFAGKTHTFHGSGHLKTGADEDSRIYVDQEALTHWTGVTPTVYEIQIPGGTANVEAAVNRLHAVFPTATITPVRQLVEGESSIVDKTHSLMFAAVLLIALTVAVSVLATLSASVLERRRDFALMKALGGSESQLMSLFLLETLVLASAGVAAGYVLGSAVAWLISEINFGTSSLPSAKALPLVILLNVAIAALAAIFPIRALRSLEPAALLKGE